MKNKYKFRELTSWEFIVQIFIYVLSLFIIYYISFKYIMMPMLKATSIALIGSFLIARIIFVAILKKLDKKKDTNSSQK